MLLLGLPSVLQYNMHSCSWSQEMTQYTHPRDFGYNTQMYTRAVLCLFNNIHSASRGLQATNQIKLFSDFILFTHCSARFLMV